MGRPPPMRPVPVDQTLVTDRERPVARRQAPVEREEVEARARIAIAFLAKGKRATAEEAEA